MKIHLATDHAGFEIKEYLKDQLAVLGHEIIDHGAGEYLEGDDYPDFVLPCAQATALDAESLGVVLGGSGQGEAMCANRVIGIRAIVWYGGNTDIVRLGRQHNNANMLSLAARFVSKENALEAVNLFINTSFSNDERHVRRLSKF